MSSQFDDINLLVRSILGENISQKDFLEALLADIKDTDHSTEYTQMRVLSYLQAYFYNFYNQNETALATLGQAVPAPVADTVLARLKQIHESVDGLELSVDNIDIDMDDLEAKLDTLNTNFSAEDFSSETTLAAFKTEAKAESDATQVLLTAANALITTTNNTLAVPLPLDDHDRIAKARAIVGEEIRTDDITSGDLYFGAAPDGTATSAASWNVVRYYRTATGAITRQRYRTGVVWDDRTAGWT